MLGLEGNAHLLLPRHLCSAFHQKTLVLSFRNIYFFVLSFIDLVAFPISKTCCHYTTKSVIVLESIKSENGISITFSPLLDKCDTCRVAALLRSRLSRSSRWSNNCGLVRGFSCCYRITLMVHLPVSLFGCMLNTCRSNRYY